MQKDIQSLFNFDKLDLYRGFDWKKEFKAPSDFCFGLKYPQIQKVSPKYMKYICCETERDYKRWMAGIRLVKFGRQLYENYKRMTELVDLSKISGFLLLTNNRRTSANLSNTNRPKSNFSNYSVNSVLLERSNSVASNVQSKQPQQQQQSATILPSTSLFNVDNNKPNDGYDDYDTNTIRNNYTDETVAYRTNNIASKLNQPQQIQLYAPIKTNNEASSLLNMLKPARRSQSSVSSLITSNGTLQKQAKLPVNTGITMHMLSTNDVGAQSSQITDDSIIENKYNYEQTIFPQKYLNTTQEPSENPISPIIIKTTARSNSSSSTQDSNVFDFPSPPAELLEPPFAEQFFQTNLTLPSPSSVPQSDNFVNRLSKGSPPTIAPKPILPIPLNRSMSNCSSYNYKSNYNSINMTDPYLRRISNNSNSLLLPTNNTTSNPQLLDELSAKLARQRKIIELDENTRVQSSCNNTTDNNVKTTSPRLQKKPPPPPRSDSIRIASSSFIRNSNLN